MLSVQYHSPQYNEEYPTTQQRTVFTATARWAKTAYNPWRIPKRHTSLQYKNHIIINTYTYDLMLENFLRPLRKQKIYGDQGLQRRSWIRRRQWGPVHGNSNTPAPTAALVAHRRRRRRLVHGDPSTPAATTSSPSAAQQTTPVPLTQPPVWLSCLPGPPSTTSLVVSPLPPFRQRLDQSLHGRLSATWRLCR